LRTKSTATASGRTGLQLQDRALELVRLRAAAQATLGDRFDLRSFHDVVLKGGAMPLEVLARVVDEWANAA